MYMYINTLADTIYLKDVHVIGLHFLEPLPSLFQSCLYTVNLLVIPSVNLIYYDHSFILLFYDIFSSHAWTHTRTHKHPQINCCH